MRWAAVVFLVLMLLPACWGQRAATLAAVSAQEESAWQAARQIWEWAEAGYQEKRSAALLSETLEKAGFTVRRGVANIPTAFTATFGNEGPIVAILGEYDALPEISQEAEPFRKSRVSGGNGHACGHNLFGVASMTAAIAIAQQIKAGQLKGTVRFYGCPAEEGGAAKAFMVRDGLFNDVAVALHWHPGSSNAAGDRSCLARIAVKFRFHGKAAHAAGSPEKGRSALDALLLTCHAAELLREHTPEGTRIHHTVTAGGGAANVVPEFAEGFFYLRHPQSEVVAKLYPRLLKCAQGGALATETRLEEVNLGATMEIFPNSTLSALMLKNLRQLNDLAYDDAETRFAVRLQESFEERVPLENLKQVTDLSGKVGMGSTDVGDVSWVVPTSGFSTACWVPGTPAHSWQAVACSGHSIGKKGMMLAARILAASAYDLLNDPKTIEAARAEHVRRLNGRKYQSIMDKSLAPPLNYRDPPKR